MATSILSYTGLLKWPNFGGSRDCLPCGRHQKIQHCSSSSMHYLILSTLLQKVSLLGWWGREAFLLCFSSVEPVWLEQLLKLLIHQLTGDMISQRPVIIHVQCGLALFLHALVMHIWHEYCSCITVNALYFNASLLITEKKRRSLSHMLEREKGCSPISALMMKMSFTCSGFLCCGQQQTAYTLYTLFLLSIRLVQPFIPKESQGVPQTRHGWRHPLHGCLSWLDLRCSCLQYLEIQRFYNNGQGKKLGTCGVWRWLYFFLGGHEYSDAGSDRMVEEGKTVAY